MNYYSIAFKYMVKGIKCLGQALWLTFKNTMKDAGGFFCKHPIFSLILVGLYVFMFITMINARVDKNTAEHQSYTLETQNDSLEFLLEPYTKTK